MTTRLGALAAATALALTGCGGGGGHSVDEAAWKSELAQQGVHVAHWQAYKDAIDKICADERETLALALTLRGAPSVQQLRTDFRYACPNRLADLEQAHVDVGGATSNVQAACDTPKDQRTDDQEQLAEAMGC